MPRSRNRRFVDDEADESMDEGPSQRNRSSRNATRMEDSDSEDYDSDPTPRKRVNRSQRSDANESKSERRGKAASEDNRKIAGNIIHYLLLTASKSQVPIPRTQIIKNCFGNDAKTRGFKQVMSLVNDYLDDVRYFLYTM